jgi:putative membrane protein
MKHKFTIIPRVGIALLATTSLCLTHSLRAAEKEEKTSEGKAEKSSLSSADKKFVQNAAKGGMMEVTWGKAASERAQNSDVKQFGARMVKDHSKANDELKSIAAKKGISLPTEEASANFKTDRAYMDMMVKDHEKDLAEFQQEAKSGSDADLKKFADKTSKVVSEHLSMARRIQKDLKRETSNLAR